MMSTTKWLWREFALHTPHIWPCATSLKKQHGSERVCWWETAQPSAQAWRTDKSLARSLPSMPRAQGIKMFHPFYDNSALLRSKRAAAGKFLITFSNPARANLNNCLTISSKHVAKVHQIHNSLKILKINCTRWLSFKNVLYIFLEGRDRWTNFHFKPPVHSRGTANLFSYFVKTQIVSHSH